MSDWIDDEVKRINESKLEASQQADRQKSIERQASGLWYDLDASLKEAVERLNQTPDITRKIGVLKQEVGYTNKFIVHKEVLPSVHLTVSNHGRYFSIRREMMTDVVNPKVKEERENLDLDLDDEGHVVFRNKDGTPLVLPEAVKYILKPLLNY